MKDITYVESYSTKSINVELDYVEAAAVAEILEAYSRRQKAPSISKEISASIAYLIKNKLDRGEVSLFEMSQDSTVFTWKLNGAPFAQMKRATIQDCKRLMRRAVNSIESTYKQRATILAKVKEMQK